MDPRKNYNKKRGFNFRQEKRRRKALAEMEDKMARDRVTGRYIKETNVENSQPVEPQKEEKMIVNTEKRETPLWKTIVLVFALLIIGFAILAGTGIWNPFGIEFSPKATQAQFVVAADTTKTPVIQTEAPVVVAAIPTEIPVVVVEPTAIPEPIAVVCDTPSIQAEAILKDKPMFASGEYLDTILGHRMTYTSRRLLIPEKAWNVALSDDELKIVEETWQTMQVCVPEGLTAVIFTGGFEQGIDRYETGALLSLKSGLYEFNMRNGEVVIWYPDQETFASKDLVRIFGQIKNGNFDIHNKLSFLGVTTDIFATLAADKDYSYLIKERNIQIIPFAEPVVK